MLVINHSASENFDEKTSEFISTEGFTIELEHSLASLSKWESIWEKPFLSDEPKTEEEANSYIQQMCIGYIPTLKEISELTAEERDRINRYVNAKMSATWFNERSETGRAREIVTTEVIYYWMTILDIPFECDQWHFNRLITLIKVANDKKSPQKKRSTRDMAAERRARNAARLQKYNTSG